MSLEQCLAHTKINKYRLSTNHVPGIVLGTRDWWENSAPPPYETMLLFSGLRKKLKSTKHPLHVLLHTYSNPFKMYSISNLFKQHLWSLLSYDHRMTFFLLSVSKPSLPAPANHQAILREVSVVLGYKIEPLMLLGEGICVQRSQVLVNKMMSFALVKFADSDHINRYIHDSIISADIVLL